MTESCTTTPQAASPNVATHDITVNEAGDLRASMPSNDGRWLIRPDDLATYVERFSTGVPDGPLESPEVRGIRQRAEVDADLAEVAQESADPDAWRDLMVREFALAGWAVEPPEGLTFLGRLTSLATCVRSSSSWEARGERPHPALARRVQVYGQFWH